jgi:hypothetical protein
VFLEQLAHQSERGFPVSSGLHKSVEPIAIGIDGPPQPVFSSLDGEPQPSPRRQHDDRDSRDSANCVCRAVDPAQTRDAAFGLYWSLTTIGGFSEAVGNEPEHARIEAARCR